MIQALLVCVPLAAHVQDPAPNPGGSPEAGRPAALPEAPADSRTPAPRPTLLNAVQLIVNEDSITTSDLMRGAARQRSSATTEAELSKVLNEQAEERVKQLLKEQAGRDMGFETAMVQALVRDDLEKRKEQAGSVSALARELDQGDFGGVELREYIESYIYAVLWERSVNGLYPGPGGRPYVDRHVRPGQLLYEFRRQGSKLDLPAMVRLEELIIVPQRGESLESVRHRAELVLTRYEGGEDFGDLALEFGPPGRSPELRPLEESKLALIPEIKEFLRAAAPGEVSEVLAMTSPNGQLAGFRILRFVERQAGKAASFVDRDFQSRLTHQIQERLDTYREDQALRVLLDAAYIWPPEVVGRTRPTDAKVEEVDEVEAAGGS